MSTLLNDFQYARPTSLDELQKLVSSFQANGEKFLFSAGGTNLVPLMKTQLFKLDHMISLTGLRELNQIEQKDNHLIIGAMTTLSDVATDSLVQQFLPTLAKAAHKVASPQIRNRATIGGNIMVDNRCIYINQSSLNRESHSPCFKADGDVCHLVKSAKRGDEILCQARFVSDTAPVLLLLNAEVNIVGPHGARKIKLHDLYRRDGIDNKSLEPGEIIITLEVEIPHSFSLSYEKLAIRNALDFPSLGVAVRLSTQADDQSLSVALTGLNTYPGVFHAQLTNYDTLEAMVTDLSIKASDFAVTYQQDFFPRAYRKSMIPVFIQRGVERILKETHQ